jgi:hypothetical protein
VNTAVMTPTIMTEVIAALLLQFQVTCVCSVHMECVLQTTALSSSESPTPSISLTPSTSTQRTKLLNDASMFHPLDDIEDNHVFSTAENSSGLEATLFGVS